MSFHKTTSTPERDASLGLIFRLNGLWAKVDYPAERGEYDHWNAILDRLFTNLDYKDDCEVKKDAAGNVIDVNMDNEDYKVYKFLSNQVYRAKIKVLRSKTRIDRIKNKNNYYHAILKKDRWLRKLMMKLKLYLKEVESSPGTAMFGSGFRGSK